MTALSNTGPAALSWGCCLLRLLRYVSCFSFFGGLFPSCTDSLFLKIAFMVFTLLHLSSCMCFRLSCTHVHLPYEARLECRNSKSSIDETALYAHMFPILQTFSTLLPACLPECFPVCLTHRTACLLASVCLPSCLSPLAALTACLASHRLLEFLPACIPACYIFPYTLPAWFLTAQLIAYLPVIPPAT